MIDVKEAIQIAREHVKTVYNDAGITDVMLEEVWLSEDRSTWHVTIGFSRPSRSNSQPSPVQQALAASAYSALLSPTKLDRDYKEVQIESSSGTVLSMKIRNFIHSRNAS